MKVKMNFAQPAILNRNGINHLRIDLAPPAREVDEVKKPTLLVFALDRSGSMGSAMHQEYSRPPFFKSAKLPSKDEGILANKTFKSKMQQAIDATISFLNLLTPDDLFGLVTFDGYIEVAQGITHILPENRLLIENNIRTITSRGSTDISSALEIARSLITSEHKENYNCKIIVISDGQANRGLRTAQEFSALTLKYLQEGISVSALGIGYDYDSTVMNAIATGGGGLLYHVEDVEMLLEIFAEELHHTTSVTAKSVKLYFEIPALVEISENMNDFKQQIKDKYIEVFIGDMYNSRSLYFEIKNNFVDKDIDFTVKVEYTAMDNSVNTITCSKQLKVISSAEELNGMEKDQTLIDSVISLVQSKAIREASYNFENGNNSEMRGVFTSSMAVLDGLSETYNTRSACLMEAVQEMDEVQNSYLAGNVTKGFAKKMYAKSNKTLRDQK